MEIGAIEDLLIQRIRSNLPYLVSVGGYKGELSRDLSEIVFRPMTVLVSLASTQDIRGTYDSYGLLHTFDILVMCRNLRGEEQGRRDEDRGVYRILDDLRANLNGVSLATGLQPLKFLQEESLIISRELVAYSA